MIYTDIEGQLCTISEAIEVLSKQNDVSKPIDTSEIDDFEDVQFQDEDVDDDDNENAISVEKLKREIMGTPDSELKNLESGMYAEIYVIIKMCK